MINMGVLNILYSIYYIDNTSWYMCHTFQTKQIKYLYKRYEEILVLEYRAIPSEVLLHLHDNIREY